MNFVFAALPFFLTGLVAAALCLVVFMHGPGKTVHRCLATLLLITAISSVTNGVAAWSVGSSDSFRANVWNQAGDAVSFVGLLVSIPLALSWPARRAWAPRIASRLSPYLVLGLVLAFLAARQHVDSIFGSSTAILSPNGLWLVLSALVLIVACGPPLLLAVEARTETDPAKRDGRILMALGLGLSLFNIAARDLFFFPQYIERATTAIAWIVVLRVAVLAVWGAWFAWSLWRLKPEGAARPARVLLGAAAASGAVDSLLFFGSTKWGMTWLPDYEARLFLFALWILVPIVMLAYVVLRGQIEGLEVKLRFAISKSTVAAVFIAVFFIASEGAQQFFGERFGGPYVGILAAGGLVFAIAPLSRVADRLALKAVPASTAGRPMAPSSGHEDAYRHALRAAFRDGRMTRREEHHIAAVAQSLDIGTVDALRLREEVEHELRRSQPQVSRSS